MTEQAEPEVDLQPRHGPPVPVPRAAAQREFITVASMLEVLTNVTTPIPLPFDPPEVHLVADWCRQPPAVASPATREAALIAYVNTPPDAPLPEELPPRDHQLLRRLERACVTSPSVYVALSKLADFLDAPELAALAAAVFARHVACGTPEQLKELLTPTKAQLAKSGTFELPHQSTPP